MKTLPQWLAESDLTCALTEGWGLDVADMRYLEVGHGSYHWAVTNPTAGQFFVTVDDLSQKGFLGETPDTAFAGLRAALDTALSLSHEGGLEFVVAPLATLQGDTVRRIDPTYTVAVFPFIEGSSRPFGTNPTSQERAEVVELLVQLHRATRSVAKYARPVSPGLPARSGLDSALKELGTEWNGGPFAEPARELLARQRDTVVGMLQEFDRLTEAVAKVGAAPVITHGEPHPGNVVRADGRCLLVDWDTAGLALPERDLWMVESGSGQELAWYADACGRRVDEDALALYRLLWQLDDIAGFVTQLRAAHDATADTEQALASLGNALFGEPGSPEPSARDATGKITAV